MIVVVVVESGSFLHNYFCRVVDGVDVVVINMVIVVAVVSMVVVVSFVEMMVLQNLLMFLCGCH